MSFFSILFALIIERALPQYRPAREHHWFDDYCRHLAGTSFAEWLMSRPWGAVLSLLPAVALIALLQSFFSGLGDIFGLIFGVAVLLYSLGPRELGSDVEAYLEARDTGDPAQATAKACELCDNPVADAEPARSLGVAGAVVMLASRRLFGPVFWFLLLGAAGAAAYRLIHLLGERLDSLGCPEEMRQSSDELRFIADWAPARLTAAAYAVTGHFDAVSEAWRHFRHTPEDNPPHEAEQLLLATGTAALSTFPQSEEDLADAESVVLSGGGPPPAVEDALGLVWRGLMLWVAVIAGINLMLALA